MNAETPLPATTEDNSTQTGRRVPKKALGLLAAAALSAGAIGSVAFVSHAAATDQTDNPIAFQESESFLGSLVGEVDEFTDGIFDGGDDCPGCGLG